MKKGILYCMFLSIQLLVNQVYCNQRICMQIENVNTEETYPIPSQQSSQGVPGKRGPPGEIGPKGSQGPRGPKGIVDYERINAAIESAINELRTETEEKMNKTINDLQQRMVNCEVIHKNTCYRMILRETQMNFDQATQACRDIRMNIGYIEDETHYQKIAELVRSKSTVFRTGYWTGLLYKNSQLVTLSGNPSPFTKWYPSTPNSSGQKKNVFINVRKDTGNVNHGMYNNYQTVTQPGVLCQIMYT
ncbi:uncharacterized protein LOC144424532 [Styela clava]